MKLLKDELKDVLKKSKYFDAIAFIYWRARYFKSKSLVQVSGIRKSFWTNTPELHYRINNLGGEKDLLLKFIENIVPGDIVWDIGAYVGMYSVFASDAAAAGGKVYAFEPEPKAYALLKRNAELNKAGNLIAQNYALSDRNDKGEIYSSKYNSAAIHSLVHESRLIDKGVPVELFRGDYLVADRKMMPPDIIKLDVEGAEAKVLTGMLSILRSTHCRYLLIEVHPKLLPNFGQSTDGLRQIILDNGFSISEEHRRGDELHWICIK